jgi:hypothetical protein
MKKRLACYGVLLMIFVAIRCVAWEKDLHYGLTKWLAFKAGFTLADSETIAEGAEAPDEGDLYPAPGAVFHSACIGRNPDISRLVQEFHFPGYGAVPGPADKRAVDPGGPSDNAATDLVEKEVQAQLPHQPPQKTLTNLGIALHPLEDSWAHQGVPDTPWRPCSDDLSWGHPAARGGWRRHDADLTYLHRQDTLDTAARVYGFLVRFLNTHPAMKRDPHRVPPAWSTLEPAVGQFAKAANKADKRAWFNAQQDVPFQSYRDQKFLDKIDLPDSIGKAKSASVPNTNKHWAHLTTVQQHFPPGDVEEFVERFLTLWLMKHDIKGLMPYTDVRQLTEALAHEEGKATMEGADPESFSQLVFQMWLVRDHGLVSYLGHGLGKVAGSEKRLSVSAQLELLNKEPTVELSALRGPETDFRIFRYPDSKDFGVIIEFAHAPRDACILMIGESVSAPGRFVVKRMDWYTL